jgi:hypothetical protein
MTTTVFRAPSGSGKPVPLALSGLPDEILGRKVHYRRKELAKVGQYVHRGTGKAFAITRERMDAWIRAFKRRIAKGIKPPLTKLHTLNPKADDAVVYVVALSRSGDSLYADLQFIGDDALALAARNDVSLSAVADVMDADGDKNGEALDHVALTPIPALTNLGGYVKIAASASPFADHPVFELSAFAGQARQGDPMPFAFDPELGTKLRSKLNLDASVPDEQVAVVAAEHVAAAIDVSARASQDAQRVTALSTEVGTLKRELAAANEKVLALSADAPKELDPRTLTLMRRTFKADREKAVASGVISEAGMKAIDDLLGVNRNDGLALSLSAGDGDEADMVYSRLCEIIATHPGVKTNAQIQRSRLALSATGGDPDGPVSDARYRELMALTGAGQEVLATQARK